MAKSLKEALAKHFEKELAAIEKIVADTQNAANQLSQLNPENAEYIVNLISLWKDCGGKSIKYIHKGDLKGAIHSAEKKFMGANNGSDVQAEYCVDIKIGNLEVEVPSEYWNKYKKRH